MNKKVTMEELLPFIEDAFKNNTNFTIPITGTSMLPLLVQGRDSVTLKKCNRPLKKGDLPLYRRKDGVFVLHRVVKVENQNTYTMCGDNQFLKEKGITGEQIIGIVTEITRNGKKFSVESKKYQLYVKIGLLLLNIRYPYRRVRYIGSMIKLKAKGIRK